VPRQLISLPKANGVSGIENRVIKLVPANATGNTDFSYTTQNRIVFNVPAYPNAWINPTRSRLHFNFKRDTGSDEPEDGLPVFQRMELKSGSGQLIEQITDYAEIQRILTNFDGVEKHLSRAQINKDFRATKDRILSADLATFDPLASAGTDGVKVRHDLLCGVLGVHQEHMIPVSLFEASGGFAFTIELYLAEDKQVFKGATTSTYRLNQVEFQFELLQMPSDMSARFNQELLSGGVFSLPFKTYKTYRHYIPSGNAEFHATLTEAARNVSKVYSVFRDQGAKLLDFKGGVALDPAFVVKSYQHKYGSMYMPNAPANNSTTADGTIPDTMETMLNALSGLDLMDKGVLCSTVNAEGESRWEASDFCVVGSFTTARDDVLNGLNSASTAIPLEIDLKFKAQLATAKEMLNFLCVDQLLTIQSGGRTSLLDTGKDSVL